MGESGDDRDCSRYRRKKICTDLSIYYVLLRYTTVQTRKERVGKKLRTPSFFSPAEALILVLPSCALTPYL
jgi:hypothetical protein